MFDILKLDRGEIMYQYHANTMRDLHIGRQGENAVRQILFDISDWAAELGPGTSELIYQRSGREDPYPVIVGRDGNTIIWTITERETEYPYRNGRCELRYYVADRDGVAKSRVWTTFVEPSISTPSGDPPEEERGWFDQVIAAGAEAKSYAESAKSDADRAETAAVRQPYPDAQTGTWWVWDAASGAYVDSGVSFGKELLEQIRHDVGDLSDLTTTDKSSLVAAINEIIQTGISGGVDPADIAKAVADYMAAHPIQETDPTVPEWAKRTEKPTYTAAEVGALPDTYTPPVDATLTKSGQAADAAEVGSRLSSLSEEKVSLPKAEDGTAIPGTAGWYAVSDGAGGITWVESAPNTGGGGSGETLDTSAKIAQYDMGLHTDGTENEAPGLCITEFYDIPNGYVGKITGLVASDGNTYSYNFQRLIYQDNTVKTYWSMKTLVADVGSDPVESGLYYASAWPANKVRFTLISATLDDSYIYFTDTGDIIFAGKNTPYYGMSNISDVNALSVAEAVDNEIAMQSLSTGGEVNTAAYSGLDEAYVSMVQSNYNAMMAEALGDYNKIPIIVHTDQHGRIGADNQVVKLIGDLTNWYEVSKCINLGDTVSDRFNTVELENYLSATKHTIPLSKRLDVYGNHDAMDADDAQKFSVSQARLSPYFKNIYARRHGNLGYFTVNDDYFNVKYLVVTNIEWTDGIDIKTISSAQAKFIVDELSADDGRDIILVSHIPLSPDGVTSRDETYEAYSAKFLTDATAEESFMAMLKARKNHTSGTFTDSRGEEHAYDFSNVSGELLMSLHGHAHFEAYRKFENSLTEFIFDMFAGNTFYFGYIDRENMKFKFWKNETGVEAMEISIA